MAENNSRDLGQLKGADQVRKRPAVIFGTNTINGAFSGFGEIVANSIDEAREGYGKKITVNVEKNNVITVEDQGRGLPMDWNEKEQRYNWELALCTLYSSGKLDDSQYSMSLGLNGLGLTATQFASTFMDVWATYDGKVHYMHFEKGNAVGKMKVTNAENAEVTGTKIVYQPDPEVFPELRTKELTAEKYIGYLRKQAMQTPGLTIEFKHYSIAKPVTFYYENGAVDFIESLDMKLLCSKVASFGGEARGTDDEVLQPTEYDLKMRLAFSFCRDGSLIEMYHNASHLFEGGVTLDAMSRGFTNAFNAYCREQNKIKGINDKIVYKDIESILICIGSTSAPGNRTNFKNQVKSAITNPFIGSTYASFVYNKVKFWLDNNTKDSARIVAEVLANKRAREEASEVSKKVIKEMTKAVTFADKPKKFVDCTNKNPALRELYIVEGDSALGSVKLARDSATQAIIPVRGKIINCLKEKLTRVLANDIIKDIFRVLGCGLEAKSKYIDDLPKFDISKLNYSKIIICTDADIDGYHIRTLLLTMLWTLAPTLIKSGRVYIADTPLYTITWKKTKNYDAGYRFAFNDNEKEQVINELSASGIDVNRVKIERSKGLGENDPDMMHESTMNPLTRHLIPIEVPEDTTELQAYFNALLGDDLESRRELIEIYFDQVESIE